MPVALFGITNSGLNLFVNLLILFLVVVWISLIAWTYLDARRRIRDQVRDPCESCGKPIDPRWTLCPYCETPVRRAAPRRGGEPAARPAERPTPSARPRPAAERGARPSGDRAPRGTGRTSRPPAERQPRPAGDRAAPSRAASPRPATKERKPSPAPRSGAPRTTRSDGSGGRPAPAPES